MVTAEDLQKLPLTYRLQLVQELWDQIAAEGAIPAMSDDAIAEASNRIAELKANPSLGITAEELWKRVDASRG